MRTQISVAGFNAVEIAESLQAFLREFHERPWLMNPQAEWEAEQKVLLITVETEGDDAKFQSEGVLDEIRDCVIAYFNFPPKEGFASIFSKRR